MRSLLLCPFHNSLLSLPDPGCTFIFALFLFCSAQDYSAEPVFPLILHPSLFKQTFGTISSSSHSILYSRHEGPGIHLVAKSLLQELPFNVLASQLGKSKAQVLEEAKVGTLFVSL